MSENPNRPNQTNNQPKQTEFGSQTQTKPNVGFFLKNSSHAFPTPTASHQNRPRRRPSHFLPLAMAWIGSYGKQAATVVRSGALAFWGDFLSPSSLNLCQVGFKPTEIRSFTIKRRVKQVNSSRVCIGCISLLFKRLLSMKQFQS